MESSIIDLRGNTGGYMEASHPHVNEFLLEGKLIVYTSGRKYLAQKNLLTVQEAVKRCRLSY